MALKITVIIEVDEMSSRNLKLTTSRQPFGSHPRFYAEALRKELDQLKNEIDETLVRLYGDLPPGAEL